MRFSIQIAIVRPCLAERAPQNHAFDSFSRAIQRIRNSRFPTDRCVRRVDCNSSLHPQMSKAQRFLVAESRSSPRIFAYGSSKENCPSKNYLGRSLRHAPLQSPARRTHYLSPPEGKTSREPPGLLDNNQSYRKTPQEFLLALRTSLFRSHSRSRRKRPHLKERR